MKISDINGDISHRHIDGDVTQSGRLSSEEVSLGADAVKKQIMEVFGKYGIDILRIKASMTPTIAMFEIFCVSGENIHLVVNEIYHTLSAVGIRTVPLVRGKGTAVIYVLVPRPSNKAGIEPEQHV